MAYTRQQAQQVYNAKMRALMNKNARIKQEQDDADRAARQKRQENKGKLTLLLQGLNIGQTQGEKVQAKLMRDTYMGEYGTVLPKYRFKDPTKWYDVPEKAKRFVDPKSELEYRPEYREKVVGESVDPTFDEMSLFPEGTRPGGEEGIMTASEYDKLVRERQRQYEYQEWMGNKSSRGIDILDQDPTVQDVTIDEFTAPAPLDMAALDESAKRGLYDRWYQSQTEGSHPDMIDKLPNYETWKEGVEEGTISATYTEKVPMLIPPDQPDVPLDVKDEFYTPAEEAIEYEDDLPAPAPQPDYAKIQTASDLAQEQQLGKTKRITEFDPMGDVDLGVSPELEGAPDIMMESPQLKGAEGAPITTTVPDAKPDGKYVGKTLGALQTLQTMQGIGKTLTDEEASGADKAIAGTQAAKMLADMAAKKAGQKTAVEAVKAGTKIGGKAAVGTAAGGVIGGYTMVTEGKAAGESWKEKDYDEAILHGMGSASGGLQTAGAGMMLSGVGAPIGAVLYGIGAAGSVISSAGLMLEGLFGGGDAPAEVQKPKFDYSRYFESIRRR